jgi:hypothetical protein
MSFKNIIQNFTCKDKTLIEELKKNNFIFNNDLQSYENNNTWYWIQLYRKNLFPNKFITKELSINTFTEFQNYLDENKNTIEAINIVPIYYFQSNL